MNEDGKTLEQQLAEQLSDTWAFTAETRSDVEDKLFTAVEAGIVSGLTMYQEWTDIIANEIERTGLVGTFNFTQIAESERAHVIELLRSMASIMRVQTLAYSESAD
jgi:hypothetical protein